jgi:hypothetical protein
MSKIEAPPLPARHLHLWSFSHEYSNFRSLPLHNVHIYIYIYICGGPIEGQPPGTSDSLSYIFNKRMHYIN